MPKRQVRKNWKVQISTYSRHLYAIRPMYASWKCTKTLLSNIRFKVEAKKVQLVISIKDFCSSKKGKCCYWLETVVIWECRISKWAPIFKSYEVSFEGEIKWSVCCVCDVVELTRKEEKRIFMLISSPKSKLSFIEWNPVIGESISLMQTLKAKTRSEWSRVAFFWWGEGEHLDVLYV